MKGKEAPLSSIVLHLLFNSRFGTQKLTTLALSLAFVFSIFLSARTECLFYNWLAPYYLFCFPAKLEGGSLIHRYSYYSPFVIVFLLVIHMHTEFVYHPV